MITQYSGVCTLYLYIIHTSITVHLVIGCNQPLNVYLSDLVMFIFYELKISRMWGFVSFLVVINDEYSLALFYKGTFYLVLCLIENEVYKRAT